MKKNWIGLEMREFKIVPEDGFMASSSSEDTPQIEEKEFNIYSDSYIDDTFRWN